GLYLFYYPLSTISFPSAMRSSQSAQKEMTWRQRRPLAVCLSLESINAAKAIKTATEKSLLLLWDELPAWRRDNTFLHSGYRQTRPSYLHSLRSLFYLHNELVNIWSHLVGAIVAIACSLYLYYIIRPRHDSATPSDVLVFSCFIGGAEVVRWGNKLDYTGIVALIVGSFVLALDYGFFCKPTLLKAYLCLIFLLGTGCATISWVEQFRTPKWRLYRAMIFMGLGLSGFIPIIHGVTIYGFKGLEDRMSVTWIIIHGAIYIFGAVLYAVRHTCLNRRL
ncbi:hemolysin-III related-domain-containing protein, partial [Mariannaea sp. PMI_226]